jgi:hypothetical protein
MALFAAISMPATYTAKLFDDRNYFFTAITSVATNIANHFVRKLEYYTCAFLWTVARADELIAILFAPRQYFFSVQRVHLLLICVDVADAMARQYTQNNIFNCFLNSILPS